MLLGGGSLVMALVEPQSNGIQTGFVVSTIGVTAIVMGVRAVKVARWGSATSRAFGRGGAILGSVGTALMLYAVLGVGLSSVGVALPALSLPAPGWSVGARAAAPTASSAPDSAQPAVAAPSVPAAPDTAADAPVAGQTSVTPTTREAEQSTVAQSAGSLSFAMRQQFGAGPYPADLLVGMSAPQRILTADGIGLAPVPDGARVLYSVSSDHTAWSVTIIGAQFGSVATYSSTVGTVQVG